MLLYCGTHWAFNTIILRQLFLNEIISGITISFGVDFSATENYKVAVWSPFEGVFSFMPWLDRVIG